jgi:hypothetical protein
MKLLILLTFLLHNEASISYAETGVSLSASTQQWSVEITLKDSLDVQYDYGKYMIFAWVSGGVVGYSKEEIDPIESSMKLWVGKINNKYSQIIVFQGDRLPKDKTTMIVNI